MCEQPPYSILVRGIEADVLPTCQRYGMGVIPWSPLAGGWLSGKWRKGADRPHQPPGQPDPGALRPRPCPATSRSSRPPTRSARLADEAGIPLVHLAVAWVIRNPAVTVGDHRPAHDGAAHHASSAPPTWSSSDDVLDRIDEIVPPGTNFTWADAGYAPPMVASRRARRRPAR